MLIFLRKEKSQSCFLHIKGSLSQNLKSRDRKGSKEKLDAGKKSFLKKLVLKLKFEALGGTDYEVNIENKQLSYNLQINSLQIQNN